VEYCYRHEESQKQRLKERSIFNFQKRNKTKLYDSKIKTQKLRTRTQDMQNKCEKNIFIMLTYANMNMKKT
jgi:hypothetical protein